MVRHAIVEPERDRLFANLGRGDASSADPCTENATARIIRQRFEDMKWILEVVDMNRGLRHGQSVELFELISCNSDVIAIGKARELLNRRTCDKS